MHKRIIKCLLEKYTLKSYCPDLIVSWW